VHMLMDFVYIKTKQFKKMGWLVLF